MPIIVNLDVMMAKRKVSLGELAERVDLTPANLSILKTGKAKAVRFSTLEAICKGRKKSDFYIERRDTKTRRNKEREGKGHRAKRHSLDSLLSQKIKLCAFASLRLIILYISLIVCIFAAELDIIDK